ncbi:MAG TPA: enoyl-CoA hydratase-related protein [Actinomycetota bacterium]|nr:enoyl-CoA hydratase-related protein [Actinomycetota bacterium]
MAEFATVSYSTEGPVARIAINRPDKRNALNVEVMRELRAAFAAAKGDAAVRVAVLTGEGDKAFSAGGDLGGFTADQSKVEQHLLRGELARLFEDMRRLGKPVVARVQGHALAGGFGLMCACDIVIASDAASFGMPEINMGLWPFIITVTVTRKIPPGKALELMMTGERIDAGEAMRIGAVNKVVPAAGLDEAVDAMCATLAARSPIVMRLGKDSFYAAEDMSLRDGLEYLHGQLGICLETEDVVEGVTAFFQKREPVWKGR